MTGIVVVGAGQAGSTLAAELRSLGYKGKLTLIGDEPVPPYQRPPLSKGYLLGDVDLSRLFLRPPSFYDDQGIDLQLGKRVTTIDPSAKYIRVGDARVAYVSIGTQS